MDQPITEAEKKKIYDELAEYLISGLEKAEIFEEEAAHSADFVLKRLDTIATRRQLLEFLAQLSSKWDIYRPAYEKVKKEELLQQVQSELSQLQIQTK